MAGCLTLVFMYFVTLAVSMVIVVLVVVLQNEFGRLFLVAVCLTLLVELGWNIVKLGWEKVQSLMVGMIERKYSLWWLGWLLIGFFVLVVLAIYIKGSLR